MSFISTKKGRKESALASKVMSVEELEQLLQSWSLNDWEAKTEQDWENEVKEAQAATDSGGVAAYVRLARAFLHLRKWKAYNDAIESARKMIPKKSPLQKKFNEWKQKAEETIFADEKKQFDSLYTYQTDQKSLLGKGTFGLVYQGKKVSSGEPVAVKVLKVESSKNAETKFIGLLSLAEREVSVWKSFDHPFIIKLLGSFVWHDNVRFVTELRKDGTLDEYIERQDAGKCSDQETRLLAKQLFFALSHMHSRDVVSLSSSSGQRT